MKKILLSMAAALTMASTVQAGGYVTNTNHNAAFLRNPAQEAKIDINALYPNPAGIGFLDKGWHLSFNICPKISEPQKLELEGPGRSSHPVSLHGTVGETEAQRE